MRQKKDALGDYDKRNKASSSHPTLDCLIPVFGDLFWRASANVNDACQAASPTSRKKREKWGTLGISLAKRIYFSRRGRCGPPSITVSALSRDTCSVRRDLGFDLPFAEDFVFGVAFCLLIAQGPLSESRGGHFFGSTSHLFGHRTSDHDSLFRLPDPSGRQGAPSAQR